jgi:hypothetical protein
METPDVVETQQEEATPHGAATESVGSPISNEAYNVLAALHSKLEGLEAYRKFAKDANEEIWQNLTKADVECVRTLVDELERLVKEEKFRINEPGQTGH